MPDFPSQVVYPAQPGVMGGSDVLFREMLNMGTSLTYEVQTGAWPVANLAIFIPLPIAAPFVATQMWVCNGGTVSGNIDVGIYTAEGALVVSKGSTAHAGTTQDQTFDITDTLLNPGLYYLAVALDNNVGIIWHTVHPANNARMMGVLQMGSAFALPATATFAAMAQVYIPEIFVTGQAVI